MIFFKTIIKFFSLVSLAFLLGGCDTNCKPPGEIKSLMEEVKIERLEDTLYRSESVEEVLAFLTHHKILKNEFLGSDQYPNDTVLAERLFSMITDPDIAVLLEETRRVFGDMRDLKADFEEAFAYMRKFFPGAKTPKIQTLVTGFGTSEMYVSDTLIIIGLDYYIGPDATYTPNRYPDYILRRYQKQYIVPAIMLLLSDNYIATDYSDNTMLADMVFYGKKYYFTQKMLPCAPDSLIIWYTEKELTDVSDNQHIIWGNFIQNELLFETSHIIKEKFLGERPNTYEISAVCPGRIGAWVGWEIVRKYMEDHPEVSLAGLMGKKDAMNIFKASNYKGKAPGLF